MGKKGVIPSNAETFEVKKKIGPGGEIETDKAAVERRLEQIRERRKVRKQLADCYGNETGKIKWRVVERKDGGKKAVLVVRWWIAQIC